MLFACLPRFLLLAPAALLLAGCSRPLPPAEYRAYLADPENGLTHTREVNSATITCTYRPTELLVLQELANVPNPGSTPIDSLARAYAGKTYCALSFSRNGREIENHLVNDPVAYQQALTYLNTGIAADTRLVSALAKDSVTALASMYVRGYGATGYSTILLVFDTHRLPISAGFDVVLKDHHFGLGSQRFHFDADALAAIPPVQYP